MEQDKKLVVQIWNHSEPDSEPEFYQATLRDHYDDETDPYDQYGIELPDGRYIEIRVPTK